MKRSEIIKLLTQYLAVDREGIQDAREDAVELLTILEKKGMLPPKPQSANSDNPIFLELENYTKLLYNWEPEDE